MNGVDISTETILFVLGTIGLLALFVAGFLVWAIAVDGRKRDDQYEADTHYWMRRR